MAVGPVLREAVPIRRFHCGQRRGARGKIHRPPVVGIDQRQIPELGALIEVRHAGHGRLQVIWLSEFSAPSSATRRAKASSESRNSAEAERSRMRAMKVVNPAS